ncbi:MAG TPA: flagellar biosynthesis protein FlhF [Clostridiales bacterium]|nr:flagellar biosynthesis protein FlhF [Clostridiales bacterium]
MIIKKFQANTEAEAIELVKKDLGKNAIIMNIKTISPKGFLKFIKKPNVEITAAIDDNQIYKQRPIAVDEVKYIKKDVEVAAIEEKLNNLQVLIEKQANNNQIEKNDTNNKDNIKEVSNSKNFEYIQLVYNQLISNEVDHKYVNQILGEIESTIKDETPLDTILASVYQKIVLKLGNPKKITPLEKKTKFVFFIGPTGVGKTTTLAKIASHFRINKNLKIAFINLDTYRIAATHQLMTYAEILGIPIKVIYSPDEMEHAQEEFKDFDLVFVDTAGRSHKDLEQRDDLIEFLNTIEPEYRDVFLVLSITTKYNDLIRITEVYSDITEYAIIFTKSDETLGVGNILNIRLLTNAPLSYLTFGQNVPDDFETINPQKIAKQLLREIEHGSSTRIT